MVPSFGGQSVHVGLVVYTLFVFGLIRWWRRRRLGRQNVPQAWIGILETRVPFFQTLDAPARERFLAYLLVFVTEKYWIGASEFEITDEVRVVIAAVAVRLVLYMDIDVYDRLTEIVVYPGAYRHPDDSEGVVLGEAHSWGTVVLSWDDVLDGIENASDGHDTAAHEFAHVLDGANGGFNGTPELRASEHYRVWSKVMTEQFTKLRENNTGQARVLRDYGATNEAEFFAVATESFFEKSKQMKKRTPELYEEMKRFYGFDPAGAEEPALPGVS